MQIDFVSNKIIISPLFKLRQGQRCAPRAVVAETLGLPEPRALEGRRGARLLRVQPGAVRETGISGNFVGRIQGAKGPFDLQFLTWDFS